ncbi:SETMAR [Cordylochernes scorpioides]|uniref:SETMAR n=1 Tax=Cordylochernes scorpioides TaxID=51811 RepID=A0ABY6LBB1_9ARAC|nr:SETMAR [Cordylochernes scorpioides]
MRQEFAAWVFRQIDSDENWLSNVLEKALSEITFMKVGGPPHISRGAKQLLKDTFGEIHGISRNIPVASKITRLDALRFLFMGPSDPGNAPGLPEGPADKGGDRACRAPIHISVERDTAALCHHQSACGGVAIKCRRVNGSVTGGLKNSKVAILNLIMNHMENRPQKFEDAELQALLDEDSTQMQEKLAKQLQVSQGAVSLRLNSLEMTQQLSRWVPHEHEKKSFLHRIVTSDEKWIHFSNPTRQKSWGLPGQFPKQTPSPNRFGKKAMLCIWWDQTGVVYLELLKPGKMVNTSRYEQQMHSLREALNEKRQEWRENHNNLILQHDNAPAHNATVVKNTIKYLGWELLPHPLYSPEFLNLPRYTPGYIIRLETGRISLSVTALKLTLKYWLRVLNMSSDRLLRICFNRTRELSNASGTPTGSIKKLTNLLNNNGSPALVSCDDPETLRNAITGLLKTAADQSIQNDLTRMYKSKLYSHYKDIHISFMTEGYLLGDFPFPVVRLLAQVRILSSFFRENHTKMLCGEDPICTFCNSKLKMKSLTILLIALL